MGTFCKKRKKTYDLMNISMFIPYKKDYKESPPTADP